MNVTAPDSPDVCLIKMIHCYAACFCRGWWWGSGKDLTSSLWLVGPLVTRRGWESWDVGRDSEESCVRSSMNAVEWAVSGRAVCRRHRCRCTKMWVKCSGKATVVWRMCTCSTPLNPCVCQRPSADLCTSCLSSFDCLNQYKGLPTVACSHQHFSRTRDD